MTRIAAIDLGTNTFNLLIADVSGDNFIRIFSEEIPVKLGEGGINAGIITKEAWLRGITAIKYIQEKITQYKCSKVKAVATSAIRSASNGEEFRLAVKTTTGIEIEVINGDREAELIHQGVCKGVTLDSVSLIMDIGGGSVEFIICDKDRVFWKNSYPVGAARLKEKFHHSDPLSEKDKHAIEEYLNDSLTDLFRQCGVYNPTCLIGSAGAFETFAQLVSIRFDHQYNKESSEFIFNPDQFYAIAAELLNSSRLKRENMHGLIPFRVDMIIPATVLTLFILHKTGIKSLKLSACALKEGLLSSSIK